MSIDKAALLAALSPTVSDVEVEGFGTVRLRQVSVAENDTLRLASKDQTTAPASDFGLRLLRIALVDETGAAVFSDADVDALRAASGTKVDKLVEAVLRVNGFVPEKNASA